MSRPAPTTAWILSKNGAKTSAIYVQKPDVFLQNFGPKSTIFKPLVALWKANHGVSMYNVAVWDVNASVSRELHFVVGTETIQGAISLYGSQVAVEEEDAYRTGMDAVLEVFRKEVSEKHKSEVVQDIETVSCLRGSVAYADWPYKKDVLVGVQELQSTAPLGTVLLRGINYNGQAGKNTVYAKMQMSQFGFGSRKKAVRRKGEEIETPAGTDESKQEAVE